MQSTFMAEEQDHIKQLSEIRSMMERSTKFMSLSGWAGVMAGVYALAGSYMAQVVYHFSAADVTNLPHVVSIAMSVLVLTIVTAIILSTQKAHRNGERAWNATSRRLIGHMALPLLAGGALILILLSQKLVGLVAPVSLIFYGIAIFNVGKYSYGELKYMGVMQVILGLIGAVYIDYSLVMWSIGFGLLHIGYGIYIHYKYER